MKIHHDDTTKSNPSTSTNMTGVAVTAAAAASTASLNSQNQQHQHQHQHQQQQKQQQQHRAPWQVDWKRPQWRMVSTARTASTPSPSVLPPTMDIVGVTTAQVTLAEARELGLIQADGTEREDGVADLLETTDVDARYLLSVSLLAPSRIKEEEVDDDEEEEDETSTTMSKAAAKGNGDENEDENRLVLALASEVLLELIDTSSSSSSLIRSKRLAWPETARLSQSSSNKKKMKKKNKSIFSVFMPLFGIDEEDEGEDEQKEEDRSTIDPIQQQQVDDSSLFASNSKYSAVVMSPPKMGLVSATLYRRPNLCEASTGTVDYSTANAAAVNMYNDSAIDLISLMNLGMPQATYYDNSNDNTKKANDTNVLVDHVASINKKEQQPSPIDNHNDDIIPTTTDPNLAVHDPFLDITPPLLGDLFLVCLSHNGKVFVYDPWTLLRVDTVSNDKIHNKNSNQDDLEQVSQYFFGRDLFQTLQESWKPLSEPIATVRLTVFQHDHTIKNEPKWTMTTESLVGGRGGENTIDNHHNNEEEEKHDDDSISTRSSLLSVSSDQVDRHYPQPKLATRNHEQKSHLSHHRRRQPSLVDPYLYHPLLEPSTWQDRTCANRPLSIHIVGTSYLVVTGMGTPYGSKQKSTHHYDSSIQWRRQQQQPTPSNQTPLIMTTSTDAATINNKIPSFSQRAWWESSKNNVASSEDSCTIDSPNMVRRMSGTNSNTTREIGDYVSVWEEHPEPAITTNKSGGFVSFISCGHWSESRTLFLPFVPISVSHLDQWNDMESVMVLGEHQGVLIRIDNTGPLAIPVDLVDTASTTTDVSLATTTKSRSPPEPHSLMVQKFQILPIDVTTATTIPHRMIGGSGTGVHPPSLLELYSDTPKQETKNGGNNTNTANSNYNNNDQALLLCKTLSHCTPQGTVALHHIPSHTAKLNFTTHQKNTNKPNIPWAEHGQGWSLVGRDQDIFFVCWEGATSGQGSYVRKLALPSLPTSVSSSRASPSHFSMVTPIRHRWWSLKDTTSYHRKNRSTDIPEYALSYDPRRSKSAMIPLPFSTPNATQVLFKDNLRTGNVDLDVVLQAMKDLSAPYALDNNKNNNDDDDNLSIGSNRAMGYSHHHLRGERLLQHCSSWTQLQDTLDDRVILERQGRMEMRRGCSDPAWMSLFHP
jgi:hypothetical protein